MEILVQAVAFGQRMSANRAQHARDLILIFGLAFLYRRALLFFFPTPYGNDAAGRLYYRDEIWTWHWLPATQVLVHVSYAATHSVEAVRLLFAMVTSLAAVVFTFDLQAFCRRRTALVGGVMFATNSLFVFLPLMPYQEIVFLRIALWQPGVLRARSRGTKANAQLCRRRFALRLRLLDTLRGVAHSTGPGLGQNPARICDAPCERGCAPLNRKPRRSWLGPGVAVAWKYRRTQLASLWRSLLLLIVMLIFLAFAGSEFASANRFAECREP